jgi:putative transposase
MPRTSRFAPGGIVFHVINRAMPSRKLFRHDADFLAFLNVLAQVQRQIPVRLLGYCLMHTHWHLLLWPRQDGELGKFMQRLTVTHVRRWHENHDTAGSGHVYQGTYKSFPVQSDEHVLSVGRYVERNPLRAGMVKRAQDWSWSSLRQRTRPVEQVKVELSDWPIDLPGNWVDQVNAPQTAAEEEAIRKSIERGRPFGTADWQQRTAKRLGLTHTFRSPGRPRVQKTGATKG